MSASAPSSEEQLKIILNDRLGNLTLACIYLWNAGLLRMACSHPGEGEMETFWERRLSTLLSTGLGEEHGLGYISPQKFSLSDSPCFNKQADSA